MIYADSSAIAKRYFEERGADFLRVRWADVDRIFTSWVAYAEVHAAMARKHREGDVPASDFRAMATTFKNEWPSYDHVLVNGTTLREVPRLVSRYPLRGYDAIHLSAALWLRNQMTRPFEFWVSDARLEAAARQERLPVVNPQPELS